MSRYIRDSRFLVPILGLVLAGPVALAQAPRQPMNYDGNAGGVRLLEEGQPTVMVHPTVEAARQAREAHGATAQASTANDLYYHGGVGGIGVETTPKIYLVFWGSQWSTDPSGEAAILRSFFGGAGGSKWLNTVTQYCQGVPSGTYFCSSSSQSAGNPAGILAGYWYDSSSAPSHPRQSQLAGEAVRAAAYFHNTASGSNASTQYVIATAHGNNSGGFGGQYCAWHSSTSSSYGNIAYTNLPYITDAGASCGANFNGLGPDAGITIVSGHEAAETITDQFPNGGWLDSAGSEIGDKCAWISSGTGASADVSFSTGTFAVQSLWSNATASCVMSY
jgi:hypothetical protein